MTHQEPELQQEPAAAQIDSPRRGRKMLILMVGLAIGFVLLIALNMK